MSPALNFVTGTVSSGKTVELILMANQLGAFTSRPEDIRIFKPALDTRSPEEKVRSATGLEIRITDLIARQDDITKLDFTGTKYILVDEIQFFTSRQIEELREVSLKHFIDITCFGLLKDFTGKLFSASKRLLELCDDIKVIKPFCSLCVREGCCANRATCNMKIGIGEAPSESCLEEGTICIGGIETFIPACSLCYFSAKGMPGRDSYVE